MSSSATRVVPRSGDRRWSREDEWSNQLSDLKLIRPDGVVGLQTTVIQRGSGTFKALQSEIKMISYPVPRNTAISS